MGTELLIWQYLKGKKEQSVQCPGIIFGLFPPINRYALMWSVFVILIFSGIKMPLTIEEIGNY